MAFASSYQYIYSVSIFFFLLQMRSTTFNNTGSTTSIQHKHVLLLNCLEIKFTKVRNSIKLKLKRLDFYLTCVCICWHEQIQLCVFLLLTFELVSNFDPLWMKMQNLTFYMYSECQSVKKVIIILVQFFLTYIVVLTVYTFISHCFITR